MSRWTDFTGDQIDRLECLLSENVGAQSVTVGGQTVTYADLLAQYDYWKSRKAREEGSRPRVQTIELGGFP